MTGDSKNRVSTREACSECERSQTNWKETLTKRLVGPGGTLEGKELLGDIGLSCSLTSSNLIDHLMKHNSVSVIIRKLKAHFARHGIPEQLVIDNGSPFSSSDFLKS